MYEVLRSDWPKRVALCAALIVGLLGITALVGWHFHRTALFQILPTLVPTERMTALGFVLMGAAVFTAAKGHRGVAVVCTLVVLVQAVLVCLEYALNISFGIDQLLGQDYINFQTSHLGRMSPVTALCFLGSCVAVLAIAKPVLFRYGAAACGIVASVLIAVSTVNALGILLGHTGTYGWNQLTRMSLHASICFAFLAVGLFAWAWQVRPQENSVPDWLPLGIGLGVAAAAFGLYQALMLTRHQEIERSLLYGIILAGGLVGAFLVALAAAQAVRAQRQSRELQAGKDLLDRIVEAPPDALLLMDRRGHIVRVNRRIEAMFGYRPEELLGESIETLVPSELREQHRILREGYYGSPSPRPMGSALDLRALRKDGSQFPVEISLGPVESRGETQVLAVVRDITERRQAQEMLRLGNEIIASLEDGLCLVRASDSTILFVNPKFEKMFGYDPGEMIGKHAAAFYSPTDKSPEQVDRTICTNLARRGVWRGEIRNRRKDGTRFFSSVTVSVFNHPGFGKLWVSIHEDITARKQVEQKLRLQAALLDLAQDAVIVRDLDGKITFWNQGATETYGWRRREAVGRVAHDLWQTRFPSPLKEIEAVLATEGHWEGELEHTSRDGKTIVVDSRWSLQRDARGRPIAVLEINRDITRRKAAEEQLRNVTERLSLATRTASIGIWDLNWRTKQAVWDDTTFEIFGMHKVVPLPWADIARCIHPDDLALVEASLQRAVEGKTQDSVEFRAIRPDGSIRHASSVIAAVRNGYEHIVRLVGTVVDITERKEMEEQIEASKVNMASSARLSALGLMAGGVAHEINNPLAIIHASAADLVRQTKGEGGVSPAIAARNGQRILDTANRVTRIIKSLRLLSREGRQDRMRPVAAAKIVEDTLEVCRERFKHHSIQLFEPDVDPGLTVLCREVQIGQVLLNLLQNAFDAVNQAGEKWIRLEVTEGGDSAVFSVIDSGPGVPPELRNKIMEPFFTTKAVGSGVGLGLSLSRTMIEEHGSKLKLTEEAGHTSFSFNLALAQKEQAVCA